jgi:hypothetical protein
VSSIELFQQSTTNASDFSEESLLTAIVARVRLACACQVPTSTVERKVVEA